MPVLKAEASHYNADLNSLRLCCQCVDVVFYHPDLSDVVEAHKIVLCAVSHVFMLLFNVKSPADIQDASIVRTAQDLFAVTRDSAPFAGSAAHEGAGNPPLRVCVKDALFCSCLSDILRFIYSGTACGGMLGEWGRWAVPLAGEHGAGDGVRLPQCLKLDPALSLSD